MPSQQIFIRPDVEAFLQVINAGSGPRLDDLDSSAARCAYSASKKMTELELGDVALVTDILIPGPSCPIAAKLFDVRRERLPGPLVMFFHGGGFVIGDISTHASLCGQISRSLDLPVLSVDYRLAPENPWPAAPIDCEAASRWASQNAQTFGRNVTSLIMCGDSAGGNLAIGTALALRDAPGNVPVIAQIVFYPIADSEGEYSSSEQFADGFSLTASSLAYSSAAYCADPEDKRFSPLKADLEGMPPAIVVTAGLDPIRDQGRAYAAALVAAGVECKFREATGNIHGFATLRKAIPSSISDVDGALRDAKLLLELAYRHAPMGAENLRNPSPGEEIRDSDGY